MPAVPFRMGDDRRDGEEGYIMPMVAPRRN